MITALEILALFLIGLACGLALRGQKVTVVSPCANFLPRDPDGLIHELRKAGDANKPVCVCGSCTAKRGKP
jgi:transketolase C-terminal domain/subunit